MLDLIIDAVDKVVLGTEKFYEAFDYSRVSMNKNKIESGRVSFEEKKILTFSQYRYTITTSVG